MRVPILKTGQPDPTDPVTRLCPGFGLAQATEERPRRDVVQHRFPGEDRVLLEHETRAGVYSSDWPAMDESLTC